jgi:arsenite methyltransferase
MKAEPTLSGDVTELVDIDELRREVKEKYREVASNPHGDFHFHTGREHALRIGYPRSPLDMLPDEATDAFAGVGNPFYWGPPEPKERVIDLGSGTGMDSFLSALAVGPEGRVIGVDMTFEMLERSRNTARSLGLDNVEFRAGVIEDLPVESAWADLVISNGVVNLCADKVRVYKEVYRVLKPGGRLTIADICVDKPVPASALRDIDLWTG